MIQELVNYAEWLRKDFPDLFLAEPEEGLHILLSFDNDGHFQTIKSVKIGKHIPEINQSNKFVFDFAERVAISNVISGNKCLHNDKYLLSNNPFCYKLNLVTDDEIKNKFSFDNISSNGSLRLKKIMNHLNVLKFNYLPKYDVNVKPIAEKAIKFVQKLTLNILKSIKFDNVIQLKSDDLLTDKILSLIKEAYLGEDDSLNSIENFSKKLNKKKLILYFDIEKELYDKTSEIYYKEKGGLKQSVPTLKYNDKEFMLSSFINNDNDSKLFLKHLTSFWKYNFYQSKELDDLLSSFKKIMKFLPNPLPIFIVNSELNKKYIKIFKQESKKKYREIVTELFKEHKSDFGNYYLFNGNRVVIYDFDYVHSFNYKISEKIDKNYFSLFELYGNKFNLENIFDIEDLFDSKYLFKIKKDTGAQFGVLKNNYFSPKIDVGKGCITVSVVENNIYKYRKLLYDAFYKSRLYLITPKIVKDICWAVIRYEISHDETDNGKYSKNEYRIKDKLVNYIQLNQIFDKQHINFGGINMASKLPEYYENTLKLLNGEIECYETNEDFAFGTGQIIRFLLEQSESGNKNHSMFEPFLQKLGNFDMFIAQINKTIRAYSHKIKMNYDTVDKLISNTTAYELDNNKTLKDLETTLVCGYFSKSAIKETINDRINRKTNNGGSND